MLVSLALAAEPAAEAPPAPPQAGLAPPQPAAAAPADTLPALLARADQGYAERDQPAALEASRQALEAALKLAPADAGALWRLARLEAWRSEDPAIPDKKKSELGKRAWELAERAIAIDPAPVEPWFYAVSGMGNYSLGIGILSALAQGIEGKFRDRLQQAERRDAGFQRGAIPVAWARFYFKLPWPKHDAGKSERMLRSALLENPDNVRARVYLAELYLDENRVAAAREEYLAALAKPPGQYDAPEERRWQDVARAGLAGLGTKKK
ncbi:MAG: tetratricopeptide repeat protein [Anaeromyxobacter sp.]|nr:tetratricopeptide repeat protein [Anaeromyxobacter sp.]MBL0274813.1 tetratricopeptide repeat protein [Anaeromyxobacter sp.]